jgi:hypothetical protein
MKVFLFALLPLLSSLSANAEPNWQVCLDHGNFILNSNDGLLNFTKVAKTDCNLRFVTLGGKGEKLEINLCDANIHVDQYPAIDSTEYARLYAGSAGCPAPTFGADFNERLDDLQKYELAKARVFGILESVNKIYPKSTKVDLETLTATGLSTSEAKTACANYLTRQYLDRCTAFEEKKTTVKEAAPAPANLPPGVHPAVIDK